MDAKERDLEKQAAGGDLDAQERLHRERSRRERPSMVRCELVAQIAVRVVQSLAAGGWPGSGASGVSSARAVLFARDIVDAAFGGAPNEELEAVAQEDERLARERWETRILEQQQRYGSSVGSYMTAEELVASEAEADEDDDFGTTR